MNYLKRNLPFDEEMMEDKALPAFIRNSVPAERKCVEVYCLLGDPAMRIFPEKRRGVEIAISGQAKQSIPLPPGLVQAELRLNEEWGARPESLKNLHLQMCADNKPNDVWCDLPCPAAFAVGVNPVTIDTASLGYDGGAFALRALESRGSLPSTVWSEVKFRQANVYPPKPVVNFNRMYDYAKKGFALTLNVFPKDFVGDRKKVETKIQVGEKRGGAEPTLIKEIDFSLGFRHSLAGAYAKDGCFVRAKQRLNGKEGEWSDWKSLTEDNHGSFPKNAGVFFVRDNKRFSLGEGLFAIPTPLFFGDEAQFQVRDQRSQAVIADTGWTKDRFHRVNPADKAEIRARCRENGKILDWSPWKSSEQSKRKAASRRP